MRRRELRGTLPLVAVLLLALPAPARPATAAGAGTGPRVHVAGIDPGATGGPRRTPIPWLAREGGDRRAQPGDDPLAGEPPRAGPLAPTILPPTFDAVSNLAPFASPGDPTGALGVTHHLAAVNVHMAFYDRAGVRLGPVRRLKSLDEQLPAGAVDFDPKVVYDPYRQHFLLVFAAASNTQSFLSVVVIPEGSEGTINDWCVLHMTGDQVSGNGKQFADYPMIGFTQDRVTITSNQFDYRNAPLVGAFRYAQVISMRKTHLYDCSVPVVPIKVFSRTQTRDPDGSPAFTIVPTISVGGAPTTQFMTSLDAGPGSDSLILWRLRIENGALRLARVRVGGGPMTIPPWGRQCGNATGLNTKWDTGDLRLTSSFFDGALGRVFTATAVRRNLGGGSAESVVRWWDIDPALPLADSRVARVGHVGAAGRDVAWPSVATDGGGRLWVNYARAGVAECLASYASVIQPGARGHAPILLHAGDGRYETGPGPERWGDYTAITPDPIDPAVVATYGAYPTDDGGGAATARWQQVVATLTDV